MAAAMKRMEHIDCFHVGDPLTPDKCINQVITGRNLLNKNESKESEEANQKVGGKRKRPTKEGNQNKGFIIATMV